MENSYLATQNSYTGWVPCLSGALCFDFIDAGLGINRQRLNFPHDTTHQSTILYSEQDWKDRESATDDGDFCVLLFSQQDKKRNTLQGSIFLTPKEIDSGSWLERIDFIKKCQHDSLVMEPSKESVKLLYTPFLESQKKSTCEELYQVDFKVDAQGFTELFYITNKNDDEETVYTATRQAFYYLKYALHQHKHHPHDDDSLTTIFEKDNDSHKDSLSHLIRQVIILKRLYDSLKYVDKLHLGIVSYAHSLLESLKSKDEIPLDYYEKNKNYLNNIEGSIASIHGAQDQKTTDDQNAFTRTAQRISILIGLTSVYIVASKLLSPTAPDSQKSLFFEHIFVSSYGFISFLIVTVSMYVALWLFDTNFSRHGNSSRKLVKRFIKDMDNRKKYVRFSIYSIIFILIGTYFIASSEKTTPRPKAPTPDNSSHPPSI